MSTVVVARLEHLSLVVEDLERSIAFYCGALAYTVLFRDNDLGELIASMLARPGLTCALAQLRPPVSGALLELIRFPDPLTEGVGGWGERRVATGQGHLGLRVENLDAAQGVLSHHGARPLGAVTAFPEGCSSYWREPGGSTIELTEFGPAKGRG